MPPFVKKVILVAAKCEACDRHYNGAKVGNYFGRVFDLYRWKRNPKCANCKGPMTKLYEIKFEEVV